MEGKRLHLDSTLILVRGTSVPCPVYGYWGPTWEAALRGSLTESGCWLGHWAFPGAAQKATWAHPPEPEWCSVIGPLCKSQFVHNEHHV